MITTSARQISSTKTWGLQTDGGLWQQAWYAVVQRGSSNQSLRKVKGHATLEDIQKGISKEEDKKGNDKSDELADDGGIADRHDKYGSFIKRVQKFIADVLIAEKERRAKDKQVSKVVLGYDPDKWAIRTMEMPPPIKGKHK